MRTNQPSATIQMWIIRPSNKKEKESSITPPTPAPESTEWHENHYTCWNMKVSSTTPDFLDHQESQVTTGEQWALKGHHTADFKHCLRTALKMQLSKCVKPPTGRGKISDHLPVRGNKTHSSLKGFFPCGSSIANTLHCCYSSGSSIQTVSFSQSFYLRPFTICPFT